MRWFGPARGRPTSLYVSPTPLYGFKEHQFDTLAKLLDQRPLLEHLELGMMNGASGLYEGLEFFKKMVTTTSKDPKVPATKGKRPWGLVKSNSIQLNLR